MAVEVQPTTTTGVSQLWPKGLRGRELRVRWKWETGVSPLPELSLMLLFFRHSAKSSIAQEERLATSPQLVIRLHVPHAIVVRLSVHKADVGFSIQDVAMDVARSAPQRAYHDEDVTYLLP